MAAGARLNPGAWMAIGWVLSYLVLAGAIGLELDWGRHILPHLPMPKPIPAARTDYPIQPEFALATLEQSFAETTARPVFTPVRRPPPPSVQTTSALKKGQFILLGALITNDKSIAMLRDVATGKAMRVEQGREISGITVDKIYPEKVVLTQGGETEELVLKIQPAAKPPAVPKAVPGQPPIQPVQAAPQAAAGTPPGNAPGAATSADGGVDPQSLINRRRATRGLPPV